MKIPYEVTTAKCKVLYLQYFKNNIRTTSCGPPVGTYNLPDHKSKTTSFHKSERFKDPKVLPVKDISRNKSDSSLHSFSKGAMLLQYQSTCKKKEPQPKRYLKENSDIGFDFCRKSLEADVEFQESKVNSLLEKVRSLEVQMKETKLHSDDIEQSNQKLLDLLESIRKENFTLQQKNEELTVALNKIVEEKGEIEKLLKEKLQYVDELKREIDNLQSQHEKEKEHLNEKLSTAQDLNCDFREQLESVELAMTENLRGLSDKYETLENTLEQVQKDYRNRLERSNSLLEKTKEAHEKSKEELTTMQNINETLKGNIETISKEVNTSKEELNNKEILIQKYKEKELEFMEEISCIENTIGQERKVMKEKIAAHEKQVEISMENEIELKRKYDMLQAEHSKTIAAMQSEKDEGKNKENSLEADIVMLEKKLMTAQEEMNIQKVHFKEKEEQVSRLETNLMTAREEINIQKVHFKEKEEQVSRERKQMQEEFMKIQNEVAKQLMETQIKLSNAEAKIANVSFVDFEQLIVTIDEKQYESVVTEMEMWRKKYNELEKKVAPFMSELDRFEMEKESLLNENKYTQQEMNKLSEKYAQILGHQNNKQKIHHIRKLKEENLSLKTEVMRLRSLQHKAGKTKLSDNGSSIGDKKSAKLFSHPDKENDQSYRQPLKTSNT